MVILAVRKFADFAFAYSMTLFLCILIGQEEVVAAWLSPQLEHLS